VALVNVPILLPGGRPYGLLQVDSREPRDFAEEDVEFLRTYATILGPVIDRLHKAHSLREALDANRRLLQELQHRVKNHIGVVTSLVQLRAQQATSGRRAGSWRRWASGSRRCGLVHEQLYVAGSADRLPLRPFITQLVENLRDLHEGQSGEVRLDLAVEEADLGPEVAVPLGLILTEFVTNSLKYAFDGRGGTIAVAVEAAEEGGLRVRVSDDGKGLPPGPRAARAGLRHGHGDHRRAGGPDRRRAGLVVAGLGRHGALLRGLPPLLRRSGLYGGARNGRGGPPPAVSRHGSEALRGLRRPCHPRDRARGSAPVACRHASPGKSTRAMSMSSRSRSSSRRSSRSAWW
jgi:two-component sensor histidine kinase